MVIRDREGANWVELKVNLNTITKAFRFPMIQEKFMKAKNLKKDLGNLINVEIGRKKHKNGIFFHELTR